MHISSIGLNKLIAREGLKTKAYRDSKGIWTIGVGHTSAAGPPAVTPDLVLTHQQVLELLDRDIVKFENEIKPLIHTELTQNEWDSIVSFVYNIGTGGFRKSKTLKLLNAGQKEAAGKAMMGWVTPPEITGRRKTEVQQFLTPYAKGSQEAQDKPEAPEATPVAKPSEKPITEAPKGDTGQPSWFRRIMLSVGAGWAATVAFFQDHWLYLTLGGLAVLAVVGVYLFYKRKT